MSGMQLHQITPLGQNLVLVKAVPVRRCPGALLVNPTLGKCVDLDCHFEVGKLYMLCFPACPDSLEA